MPNEDVSHARYLTGAVVLLNDSDCTRTLKVKKLIHAGTDSGQVSGI